MRNRKSNQKLLVHNIHLWLDERGNSEVFAASVSKLAETLLRRSPNSAGCVQLDLADGQVIIGNLTGMVRPRRLHLRDLGASDDAPVFPVDIRDVRVFRC